MLSQCSSELAALAGVVLGFVLGEGSLAHGAVAEGLRQVAFTRATGPDNEHRRTLLQITAGHKSEI